MNIPASVLEAPQQYELAQNKTASVIGSHSLVH